MTKHLIKALQTELDSTRSALDSQAQIISRIKSWLVDEVNTYQDIQTRVLMEKNQKMFVMHQKYFLEEVNVQRDCYQE